jgi:hypothetical protein
MTQDEIIEMARQAGMDYLQYLSPEAFEKVVVFSKLVAQRTWVGLTDEDRLELAKAQHGWEDLLIATEAKLKEKNNV